MIWPFPKATPVAGLIALLTAAGATVWMQHERNTQLAERIDTLREDLGSAQDKSATLQTRLETLALLAVANDHAQAQLRTDLDTAKSLFDRRAITIERLTHENAQLREWSAAPLPDAARQLRGHPEVVGAAAYRAWLSERDGVPPAGEQPDQQRPAADAGRPD